jgi:hypothetical protein
MEIQTKKVSVNNKKITYRIQKKKIIKYSLVNFINKSDVSTFPMKLLIIIYRL